MIHNITKSLILLLIATVLLSACRTEKEISVPPAYPDISIAEAKAWFTPQSAKAKLNGEKPTTRRTEFWNLAQKQTYANGLPVVVVPLTYNYDKATASRRNGLDGKKAVDKTDYTIQKKLLIYKDQKGNIVSDVITIIPTDDSRKKSKKVKGDTFDGYVLAYDNAEKKFMGGWYYENGKPGSRVRMTGKGGRVMGDCDVLVYRNEGPNPPAQVGGGGLSTSTSGFWDGLGNHWQLDYTIPLDCGNGFGNNAPPSGSQGGNEGDVAWFWNATPGSSGGGGGGSAPYTPIMIGDDGLIGGSPADNFFYDMMMNYNITGEEATWLYNQWTINPQIVEDYKVWKQHSENLSNLSSADMRRWADTQGITSNIEAVRANRRTGYAFEKAALKYSGAIPNGYNFPSSVRANYTNGGRNSVRPDGREGLTVDGSINVENYLLWEVKCVNGTIGLSSNEHQIRGVLDVLQKKQDELRAKMGGTVPPYIKPVLYFMTTSDTSIGQDVINQATSLGIRIYQMKAKTINGDLSNYWIGFGPMRALNFLSEPDSPTGEIIHRIADFIRQYTSDVKLIVPNDVDGYDDDDND